MGDLDHVIDVNALQSDNSRIRIVAGLVTR